MEIFMGLTREQFDIIYNKYNNRRLDNSQKQPQAPFQKIQDRQGFCYSHRLCRNQPGDYEHDKKHHHFHKQIKGKHTEFGNG